MSEHRWSYCNHCQKDMVICGTCGNNCCNGGYGEVMGPKPGTTMVCPDCPSAYAMQRRGQIQRVIAKHHKTLSALKDR